MRPISIAIVAILPFTLGLPLHEPGPEAILSAGVVYRNEEATADKTALIDRDRPIAVHDSGASRNGLGGALQFREVTSSLTPGDLPVRDTKVISAPPLHRMSGHVVALGDEIGSMIKRGILGAIGGGLLSGSDPLGGLLNLFGSDSSDSSDLSCAAPS